jgi:hypothetical protein
VVSASLTPHEILELRATLGDLKDVVADNTKALLELKTQQQQNTQKLLDVSQAQYPQIFAALMDALSGGIGGPCRPGLPDSVGGRRHGAVLMSGVILEIDPTSEDSRQRLAGPRRQHHVLPAR